VEEWAAEGYPASAMRNYLARLGWSHGDEEFFTDEQAIEWFDLDGIRKAPARFDTKKLASLSGQHIAAKDDAALVAEIQTYLTLSGQNALTDAQAKALTSAMYCLKDRAKTYPELLEKAHFVLAERPLERDDKSAQALDPVHIGILNELTPQLQNASWNRETLEALVGSLAERHNTKLGKLAAPLRAALAGRAVSPSVFDMMLVLGRDETVLRLGDVTS
jgi:glutamyl-tRNA synthetase